VRIAVYFLTLENLSRLLMKKKLFLKIQSCFSTGVAEQYHFDASTAPARQTDGALDLTLCP
jgi:hypothetical protein